MRFFNYYLIGSRVKWVKQCKMRIYQAELCRFNLSVLCTQNQFASLETFTSSSTSFLLSFPFFIHANHYTAVIQNEGASFSIIAYTSTATTQRSCSHSCFGDRVCQTSAHGLSFPSISSRHIFHVS